MAWLAKMNRRTLLANGVLAGIGAAIAALSFSDFGRQLWSPKFYDRGLRNRLSKPLRLEVERPDDFRQFVLGLRTFHYRVRSRGTATYSDI